jgi:DNA repair protein RadA/Sms
MKTGIGPLDALLGDGFVPGSSVLLTGPPGAGKSTLVMQILKRMSVPALHVTGEESIRQLKLRADRLKGAAKNVFLLFETNCQSIMPHVDGMKVLVIDSIQTLYTQSSDTLPGSSTQIRKCAYVLRRLAQEKNIVLILIGQVTKEKKAAGPRLLEHAVDVVLHLDIGDRPHRRILFASKNRFGATPGRCDLSMRASGLAFCRMPGP